MSAGRVDTIPASAGTGKTTAVVRRLADAIAAGTPPERVLATTFTVRAADVRARPAPECVEHPVFLPRHGREVPLRPLRIRPSSEGGSGAFRIVDRVRIGERLRLSGSAPMALVGEAIHTFLAADRHGSAGADRRRMAGEVLERWGVAGHLGPDDLVAAGDRLWALCGKRFADARLTREPPVFAAAGTRTIAGRVDLLAEWDGGFAVLDHKSFPGGEPTWEAAALIHGPQLALYAEAVATATGSGPLGSSSIWRWLAQCWNSGGRTRAKRRRRRVPSAEVVGGKNGSGPNPGTENGNEEAAAGGGPIAPHATGARERGTPRRRGG